MRVEDKDEFSKIKEEAKKDIKEEIKEDVLGKIPEKKSEIPAFKKPAFPAVSKPMPKINWWAMGALIFFVLFLASMFTNGFSGITGMSAVDAGDKAMNYLNTQLLPPGTEATLISTESLAGVYKLKMNIDGEEYDTYVTKDGNLFFISGIELTEVELVEPEIGTGEETEELASEPAVFDAPDAEEPLVQLFIMSYCPYGQQAVNNIASTIELLGEDISFEPRFIVNVQNDTINSLHGSIEADEDMRQACIWKYYPESWLDYVLYVNENIPLNSINEEWTTAAEEVGLDIESIETCVNDEGLELMQADDDLTDELGITGSPTLLINGERYSGQRTPESFKQAICSGFEEQPDSCLEELEEGSAATGSC